jgi:3',5'-cyclic AMP phosphodiesterase CpdA
MQGISDFVFTGDLTHTTEDGTVRHKRMDEFRGIVSELEVKDIKFMPGEHDASLDRGKAFQEFFGATHYSFDHKGVHFVAIDNVSDPGASIGEDQLAWLAADLERQPKDARIVVFTHRPLFDLYPQWDWATTDGAKAIEILQTRDNVTAFYGHIHQEHHHTTGRIEHHAAKGLMFALPAPGSQLKRTPVATPVPTAPESAAVGHPRRRAAPGSWPRRAKTLRRRSHWPLDSSKAYGPV